jgi:hypothetical protein
MEKEVNRKKARIISFLLTPTVRLSCIICCRIADGDVLLLLLSAAVGAAVVRGRLLAYVGRRIDRPSRQDVVAAFFLLTLYLPIFCLTHTQANAYTHTQASKQASKRECTDWIY